MNFCKLSQNKTTNVRLEMLDHGFLHAEQTALGQTKTWPWTLVDCYLHCILSIASYILIYLHTCMI